MRKFLLLAAAAICAVSLSAGSFGIKVNGSDYHAGEQNPNPMDPSFQEFMVLGLQLSSGNTLQLWDGDNNVGWAVDLDPASVQGISRDGDHYNCTADGCYDFYIKIKENADQLYVGACQGQGGGGEGGGGGGSSSDHYYYYKGYVDGADIETYMEGVNGFVGGKAQLSCSSKSYLFIVYQVLGVPGEEYACKELTPEKTNHHATLYKSPSPFEKMEFEPGDYTLYLYNNGDGTLELSTIELPGKTLVDAGEGGGEGGEGGEGGGEEEQAIENVSAELDTNAPMFDVTGRQVTADYKGVIIQNGHKFIR